MTTNNATNCYVSLRITIALAEWPTILTKVLEGVREYIAYPHMGIKTKREHYHICIPSEDARTETEKFRKRARDVLGINGRSNAVSALRYTNGYEAFVTYARHKACGEPYVSGEEMVKAVAEAPAWVNNAGQTMLPYVSSKADRERDWQLTYSNLVPQAIKHAQVHGLTEGLRGVTEHMLDHTKWKPTYSMVVHGIPAFYIDDYDRRSGKRSKRDMSWFEFKG